MLLLNPLPEIPGQLSLKTVLWFELLTDSSWEDVGHMPLYNSKGVAFFPWKLFFPFSPVRCEKSRLFSVGCCFCIKTIRTMYVSMSGSALIMLRRKGACYCKNVTQ